jgi:antitoxin (DNA-binding transcriptional repressor) of toxin-antitoxin stability system
METVNIHQAKTQLSRVVERAVRDEAFIFAKAGKPMVKVVPLDAPERADRERLGFMASEIGLIGARSVQLPSRASSYRCRRLPGNDQRPSRWSK